MQLDLHSTPKPIGDPPLEPEYEDPEGLDEDEDDLEEDEEED